MGWNKKLERALTVWTESFDVQIDIAPSQMSFGSIPLVTNHVVSGIYETIVDVAAKSRFCEVLSTLSLHMRHIGTMRIEKVTPRTLDAEANVTLLTIADVHSQSNDITYPSGRYKDPDDVEFSIDYEYSGARINSKDIFLVVIDALATAAQSSPDTLLNSIHAVSPSGDCVINIAKVGGRSKINYSFVTKALRLLITDIMVKLRKFEEIGFRLNWDASVVAEASIKLADHGAAVQR